MVRWTANQPPQDNLALVDRLASTFGAAPGVAERAAALRERFQAELDATRPDGRPAVSCVPGDCTSAASHEGGRAH